MIKNIVGITFHT